jgi:uncharacterized protein (UPF0335 family)
MYQSAAKKLRDLARRIESLESEKVGLQEDIKSLYEDVKFEGFQPKILKAAIKARKKSASERKVEQDTIDLYLSAIDDQMDLFEADPATPIEVAAAAPKGLRRKSAAAELTH